MDWRWAAVGGAGAYCVIMCTASQCLCSANIQQFQIIIFLQEEESGTVRQEEERPAAEKREHSDTDDGVQSSVETECCSKKTRVDDYFVKKNTATKALGMIVEKIDESVIVVACL